MPSELFAPEAVVMLSPRLAWMRRHMVSTAKSPCECDGTPWSAWVGDLQKCIEKGGDNPRRGGYAVGATEEDAVVALAKARRMRLWNEEDFAHA